MPRSYPVQNRAYVSVYERTRTAVPAHLQPDCAARQRDKRKPTAPNRGFSFIALLITPYCLLSVSIPFLPQRNSTQQPRFVRNNLDVLARLEIEFLRISSAQVEMVPVE